MQLTETFWKIETVSAEKAKEWLAVGKEGDVIVLDVRQPQEYRSGHLPGAVFIPLPELPDRIAELDRSKPVLAYCRAGNRSRAAAALLSGEGFASVFSLDGGITAWDGGVATGDYPHGTALLKGRETAGELIALAWALEEGSRLFYEKAMDLTPDAGSRDFFGRLVKAEESHKSSILRAYRLMGGKVDEDFVGRGRLDGIMEGGVRVDDAVAFLKRPGATLRDVIEVAMQVEINALDLYIKMRREIRNDSARKVFSALIDEEKRHLARLGGLLGETLDEGENNHAGDKTT
jgi:rhodanese-related sulfurtransferase/rubrerythrin